VAERLAQGPLDERRCQLNEVLFMQQQMLKASQSASVDSGAA
jgi:hypothetical protein